MKIASTLLLLCWIYWIYYWRYVAQSHVILLTPSEVKDLGVFLTADMKPSMALSRCILRSQQNSWYYWKNNHRQKSRSSDPSYKSLVRPQLKYCSRIRSPYYLKDKKLLEHVQHRYAKMVSGLRQLPYDKRLERLGLWTLESEGISLIFLRYSLFRIYKEWSTTTFDNLFTLHNGACIQEDIQQNLRRIDIDWN